MVETNHDCDEILRLLTVCLAHGYLSFASDMHLVSYQTVKTRALLRIEHHALQLGKLSLPTLGLGWIH